MSKPKELGMIIETPNLSLLDATDAGDVLVKFYEALGWDKEMFLDPSKVVVNNSVYNTLYDLAYGICPNNIEIGMFMVNWGPSTDEFISDRRIHLMNGWVTTNRENTSC